jgi:DnaJ-class molecular chaperone
MTVRPLDSDDVIRARYHALSKNEHPDRPGGNGLPGTMWYVLMEAYQKIKTQDRRDAFDAAQKRLSGFCKICNGAGVRGSRSAGSKIRACDICGGEGRKR